MVGHSIASGRKGLSKINNEVAVIVANCEFVKEDGFMVSVVKKLIAKVNAGMIGIMEFTPTELRENELDVVEYTLDHESNVDKFDTVAEALNLPIREIFESEEDVELVMFNCDENRPAMLLRTDEGNKYESFFHSQLCEIGGNAYRMVVDDENAFYLIKVLTDGKVSYELYLSTETSIVFDEDNCYTVHKNTQALCNDNTEVLKAVLEELYQAVYDAIHQTKISDDLKAKLEAILE